MAEHRGPRRQRVVVIGAGFGGLAAVREMGDDPDVESITLVDANNFHTFQPLLYQVATAGLGADDIAYVVRGVVRRQRVVTVRMASVVGVDLDSRRVTLDDGDTLEYDVLVVAAGAVTATFGVEGVDEHAVGLKSLDDALEVRARVLDLVEQAAAHPDVIGDGGLTVVICGGGPTGVELAGGMNELFSKVIARDLPRLDLRRVRIVVIEAADRLLPGFDPRSSERARRTLEGRGVEVVLGAGVASVDADGVTLADGRSIAAGLVVWAAGVQASPLAAELGVETTRGGRIVVEPDLSVPGRPDVFAIGDIAASPGPDGRALPQVAQVAIQGGRHVARQIVRRRHGEATEPFRYVDKGSMATIGRHDAVAELPHGVRLSGPIGWLAWLGLHLVYLIGFRNRANVLVNWAWNYLTYDRGARLLRASDRRRLGARDHAGRAVTPPR